MWKEIRKIGFSRLGLLQQQPYLACFITKQMPKRSSKNEKSRNQQHGSSWKPLIVDELKQIIKLKRQWKMSTTKSKVIDAQTEVKAAGQELEERKKWRMRKTSSQRLRMPKFRMQKMTSRWLKPMCRLLKKIRFENRSRSRDRRRGCSSTGKSVTAQESGSM